MSSEFTFVVQKPCPVCGKDTRVVKAKSRQVIQRTDTDYCCHYRDFNPYYYTIWACEHCGYAADEKHFLAVMPERHKQKIAAFLKEKRVSFQFTEERHIPEAIASYQLAIYCAEELGAPLARQASLALRMAWVFRLADIDDQEKEWERKALNLYERSIMTERYPVENLSDNMVMYLIADLHVRLGESEKAAQYLSRMINDKNLKMNDIKLYNDARNLWQDIREDKE